MRLIRWSVAVLALAVVAACGGSNGVTYTVGGTVSGLVGTVVLQSADGDTLSLTSNGPYTLKAPIPEGSSYALSVKTQPTGLVCVVVNGTGTVKANVTNIMVNCTGGTPAVYATVSTLAGGAVAGYVEGPVATAKFDYPEGIAADSCGNVYVSEMMQSRIRKVTADGTVSLLAGSGVSGSANGIGAAATFNNPVGIATDASCAVYVADTGNNLIRKVTKEGVVTTVAAAATFSIPRAIAIDASGNLYVAKRRQPGIRKITPAGVVSTIPAGLTDARGVAVDAAGNVFVSDSDGNTIRKIAPDGTVTTLAGSSTPGSADGDGSLASFNYPNGLTLDASGNIYVADASNNKVRKITPAGVVSTLAGSGAEGHDNGSLDGSSFTGMQGITIDPAGNLYVIERYGVRKISF
jgi:sugar lactone lactonase YvrE